MAPCTSQIHRRSAARKFADPRRHNLCATRWSLRARACATTATSTGTASACPPYYGRGSARPWRFDEASYRAGIARHRNERARSTDREAKDDAPLELVAAMRKHGRRLHELSSPRGAAATSVAGERGEAPSHRRLGALTSGCSPRGSRTMVRSEVSCNELKPTRPG
jgi:hypothetical protein